MGGLTIEWQVFTVIFGLFALERVLQFHLRLECYEKILPHTLIDPLKRTLSWWRPTMEYTPIKYRLAMLERSP